MAKGYIGNGYDAKSGNIKFVLNNQNENNNERNQFVVIARMMKGSYRV
jgi:hypothetical protein